MLHVFTVTIMQVFWAALLAASLCAMHAVALPMLNDVFGDDRTLTKGNFSLINHGTWLIEFFAPWCPHCQEFAPYWHELIERVDYMAEDSVNPYVLARVNCDADSQLCSEQGVRAFPSAKLYKNGKMVMDNVFQKTSRDIDKLEDFIKEGYNALHPNQDAMVAGAGSSTSKTHFEPVKHPVEFGSPPFTTLESIKDYLGKDFGQGPSFVKFYSPSCPHCRAMAHEYELAAKEMVGQVNPIAINCQKYSDVCDHFHVDGWPYLMLAKDGVITDYPDTDEYGRQKDQFLAWLRVMNVFDAINEVTANNWYTVVRKKKQTVLHVEPRSDEERDFVREVKAQVGSDMQFLVTIDETLAQRFGHRGSLLVFNENIHRPSAVLPIAKTAHLDRNEAISRVAQWLDMQNEPLLEEVTQATAGETLHHAPGVVLAALNSQSHMFETQLRQMRKIARKWRAMFDLERPNYLFRYFDTGKEKDLLQEVYDVSVRSTPSLYVVSDSLPGNVWMHPTLTRWMYPERVIKWLDEVVQGRAQNGITDSFIARTKVNMSKAKEGVNPLIIIVCVLVVLFIYPRTRRFFYRILVGSRTYRKIV